MALARHSGGSRNPRAFRVVPLVGALALAAACAAPPEPTTLSHTFDTPEALARAVLDALATRDETTLAALPLSALEFRAVVWPELPASRPEVGLPVEYAWSDLHTKSRGHLAAALNQWGGRRFELVSLDHRGETTTYETFTVRRDTVLVVRNDAGEEERVRLFGSILERDGRFKLFSYVVD